MYYFLRYKSLTIIFLIIVFLSSIFNHEIDNSNLLIKWNDMFKYYIYNHLIYIIYMLSDYISTQYNKYNINH